MERKKVALITGCSSGFGYLTALKFARNGYQTFAGVRDLESLGAKKLEEIKKQESLDLVVLKIDVTQDESVQRAVELIFSREKSIDILINNAGFGFLGPVESFSPDEVKAQYETNVFGVLRMVRAVAPLMRKQKSGLIVNLGSVAGKITFPLYGVYSSSKFALEALNDALRFELKPFGIKVVLVEPGTFPTDFFAKRRHPQAFSEEVSEEASPYRDLNQRFFARYDQAHEAVKKSRLARWQNPQKVADLIYKVSLKENPSQRYLVGFDAQIFVFLKKIIPARTWDYLLHTVYKW